MTMEPTLKHNDIGISSNWKIESRVNEDSTSFSARHPHRKVKDVIQ